MGELIRIRGLVQGVGFRPTVWRIATGMQLTGDVRNDGEGVLIRLSGPFRIIDRFLQRLEQELPPLARIDAIVRSAWNEPAGDAFVIEESHAGPVQTGVVPDAATCDACREEILDQNNRRYRYPFTNCTHCGPRLSIVSSIPYDRANTSMAGFSQCPACLSEYTNPADRRFHAQPNACPECGPTAWLVDANYRQVEGDAIKRASQLLDEGCIIAIKGIGGFHLACDATNPNAVKNLRLRKQRFDKPFALMARDLDVIGQYAEVDAVSSRQLSSISAPIVLLPRLESHVLAKQVAPDQATLGFMLPYSPLHHLLLENWHKPVVMTSGNLSDEPQCTDSDDAFVRLGGIADYYLLHNRDIVNPVDDSVVRVMAGRPRLIRRARGYAPSSLLLPREFDALPHVLAMGGELKSTLTLLQGRNAVVTQHLGDLEDARTGDAYTATLELYMLLFQFRPEMIAIDLHDGYRSSQLGEAIAADLGISLILIQHHHAHLASVLAENGWPLDAGDVVGLVLDGLGLGEDATFWGGEVFVGNYRKVRRVAWLKPVPMPGGTRAIIEPWRMVYAHLNGTAGLAMFEDKPVNVLQQMLEREVNSPLTSSAGRLFDAVAAALGLYPEAISYEGQAAIALENLAASCDSASAYDFLISDQILDPAPMWEALINDLSMNIDRAVIARRFHLGFAQALIDLALTLCHKHNLDTVALSGGVFQNKLIFEAVTTGLQQGRIQVLSHSQVPTNDGGLSLGQAAVAASRT